jgi:hypothetical protein
MPGDKPRSRRYSRNSAAAVPLEKVIKKFCDRFRPEHAAFLACIEGCSEQAEREHYASLLLICTMFVYFIQRKGLLDAQGPGLLDGDRHYLAHRLRMVQQVYGKGCFHTFYRAFLLRLFHTWPACSPEWDELSGNLPYLNSGLFDMYEFEYTYRALHIPDQAFERLFGLFDEYEWSLNSSLPSSEREISPDVIGFLFEKHNNQKQMGAYYTQEDITEYIGKNSIIPYLFENVSRECPGFFRQEGPIWALLRANPTRYIYAAVKHGCALSLPAKIEAGVSDVARRATWDEPAPGEYGLPMETWREVVTRRRRAEQLKKVLTSGEISSIDDLITYNLDLCQFARDVILSTESCELLAAFYVSLEELTILDPTCGSGEFLLAALAILEPLYAACLERMQQMIEARVERAIPAEDAEQQLALHSFRAVLDQAEQHINRRFFLDTLIITKNLYGVDLMSEVVAICKLRLFLKIVAQIETGAEIKMLPALNLNIRAGNALVGLATFGETSEMVESNMGSLPCVRETPDQLAARGQRPFHWVLAWPAIMRSGGFDVIIGNPPYVAYSQVKDIYQVQFYETQSCGNLCAYVLERAITLLRPRGRCGMIMPVSTIACEAYRPLSRLLLEKQIWISSYSNRPGKLFAGVEQRLAILLLRNGEARALLTSAYRHWYEPERAQLFTTLHYTAASTWAPTGMPLKLGCARAEVIFARLMQRRSFPLLHFRQPGAAVWVHNGPTYWVRALPFEPNAGQKSPRSNHYCQILVASQDAAFVLAAILSSSTFYFFYKLVSNCRDLGQKELHHFPLGQLQPASEARLAELGRLLALRLQETVERRTRRYASAGQTYEVSYEEYYPARARELLDEIDRVLAEHYGFSEEELDFLLHYDSKYRQGGQVAALL